MNEQHDHGPTAAAQRAAALEEAMKAKDLVNDDFIDRIVEMFTESFGPRNGARLVARAWVDDAFRSRLLTDGQAAAAELGISGPEGNIEVVENTDSVHNVIVCTLCSCYPWPVLGLPPRWYKSPPYRSRMVREPRTLLAEMGYDVPADAEVRVWDSSAEKRYMVLPQRPAGTEQMSEEELAALVTRDGMVGVAAV